jgi:hypothetical protein
MGLFTNLLGAAKNPKKDDRSDYGTLLMPPSSEAGALLSAMTEEEKFNFTDHLQHLQEWLESEMETSPDHLSFHPESRARFWGLALAKIADHYVDIGRHDKALYFMSIAWNLSEYPIFAYNLAVLSTGAKDLKHAQILLETYLTEYRNVITNPIFRIMNPHITEGELEDLAKSARARLAAIKSQLE